MPDIRPKSDLLSRVALGLSVLALLPGVLPHYGVEQRTIMALMPGVGAIVLLLFLDVLLAAAAQAGLHPEGDPRTAARTSAQPHPLHPRVAPGPGGPAATLAVSRSRIDKSLANSDSRNRQEIQARQPSRNPN